MAQYPAANKFVLLLPVFIIALYNNWILNFWLSPNLNPIIATVSEASAVGQPYNWLYRSLDCLFGIVILITLPLLSNLNKTYKYSWLLILGYVSAGIDSIIDAWLQIDCAPSIDKGCSFSVRASTLTTAHLYESLVAGAIIFFVPFVWWLCSRVEKHLFLNRISLGFIGTQVTLGFFVVIEKLLKINTYGVIHRLYLVSIAVWLSVVLFSALLIKLQNNTT